MIRIRDGAIDHAGNLREELHTYFGQIGNYPRFEPGRQNDAGEAIDVLVQQIKNLDGNYVLNEMRCCSSCMSPLNVSPASFKPGLIHNLTPKATVGEMVKSDTEYYDKDFIHICRLRREEILKELTSLDTGVYGFITRNAPNVSYNHGNSNEELYQALRNKYEALKKAQKKDRTITFRTIGTAAETIESMKIESAGDFLVISAARDPQNPIKTYPTEILTINEKDYVIRSAINHHGTRPTNGHYTASVFSNNRWYNVDDNDDITEMSGDEPWPHFSTFYFYEKMPENEPPTQQNDLVCSKTCICFIENIYNILSLLG